MKELKNIGVIVFILCGCFSLYACEQNNSVEEKNWQRMDFSFGKPGAPVVLEYAYPEQLQAGDSFLLELRFKSNTPAGTLSVIFNTEGPIQLNAAETVAFDLRDADKTVELNLTALQNALAYVNLNVGEKDENGVALMGRSFSIPIQIGPKQVKAQQRKLSSDGHIIKQDGDETIIEMQAEQL